MYTLFFSVQVLTIVLLLFVLVITLSKAKALHKKFLFAVIILILVFICVNAEFGTLLRAQSIGRSIPVQGMQAEPVLQPVREPLQAVGGAWSFFLNKNRAKNVLFTHHMKGRYPSGRWGAGTYIKDVQKYLKKENKTLTSHPSIENGTLGGWIASGSHGSGGTLWKSSFGSIRVWNQLTNEIFESDPKQIFNDQVSMQETQQFIILDVEVKPVDDVWTQKYVFKMNSVENAQTFLEKDSYLRMLQIGARGIMGLMWIPPEDDDFSHVDPHFFSQKGLWLQADVMSIFQNSASREKDWFDWPIEPQKNYQSKIKLSDANKFTPEPPLLLTSIGLAFVNFEIYVLDYSIDSIILFSLANALCDVFRDKCQGRCELRCGKTKVFLDIVVLRGTDPAPLFATVKQELGEGIEIVLHKGKAQVNF